jgi:HEAT repeat protein
MVNLLGKTILGIVAACVAQGVVLAQDVTELFHEGVKLIRIGKPEEGLEKLREVLSRDPSNEQAFDLVRQTEVEVFQMLLAEGGDFGKIAQSILERARLGRAELSRDQDRIRELAAQATADTYEERRVARTALVSDHGEFAVPVLCEMLGDPNLDEKIDRAMIALFDIGHVAVLPLIEATKSDNPQLRTNAASALVHIEDDRAAVAFARLANDPNEAVRHVAQRGLDSLGMAGVDPVKVGIDQAHAYLLSGGVRDGDYSEVVWSWKDGSLIYSDVPASLYHLELAKRRAHEAMRIDPTNAEAKSLLARSYLAQVAAVEETLAANPDDEEMQAVAAETGRLRMVAEALGVDTMRRATSDSISEGQSDVAIKAIESLGGIEERGALGGSPLVEALDAADTRVAYAAALALASAAEGGDLPASGKVVEVLGKAVEEEAIRTILFIDNNPMNVRAAREAGADTRGYAVEAKFDARQAIADFYNFPNYDVVVVSDALSDELPEDVISLVRKRSDHPKIVLLTASEDAESRYGDSVDGYLMIEQGALGREALVEKVNEVVDELDARRARATDVAIAAGHSLRDLASADVAIGAAAGSLARQLDREDAVAIPAAQALRAGGSADQIAALQAAVLSDEASLELKVAAAEAIGGIVARTGAKPAGMFDSLILIVEDSSQDIGLRRAVVEALGKAPLAPGERARLVDVLDVIAVGGGEG